MTTHQAFEKIVRVGTKKEGNANASVYCQIKFDGRRLSISGVVGPTPNGNARGAAGQIIMDKWGIQKFAPGWDIVKLRRFRAVWNQWHLNDMRAECEHQRDRGENWTTHPSAACPDCGYKLGSAWLFEEVPADVLDFLRSLPDTDQQPAWV